MHLKKIKEHPFHFMLSIVLSIALIASPFIIFYLLNNGNPFNKYIIHKYVPAYLEEVGYENQDIESQGYSEPKHSMNKKVQYAQYDVVFKDEPELTYFYGVTKKGKHVVQFCENTMFKERVSMNIQNIVKKTV